MRIGKFLSNLGIPLLAKSDLIEAIELTQQDITSLLPLLEESAATLLPMKSVAGKDWESAYQKAFRIGSSSWVDHTLKAHTAMSGTLARLHDLAEKEFGKDIAIDGVSYPNATLLQLISLANFVADYSCRNLAFLVASEANVEARTMTLGKERPAGELRWLAVNRPFYFRVLEVFYRSPAELVGLLDKIPDLRFIPENELTQESTVGSRLVDPLSLNVVDIGAIDAVSWNPFFLFGLWRVGRKLYWIERMSAEKKAIELRLEQLRMQKKDTGDAAIEKAIASYEETAIRLGEKIAKLEKR